MGKSDRQLCVLTDARGRPIPQSADIVTFAHTAIRKLEPACIILHGSMARGDYTQASDVDLVVIGGRLPERFLDRLGLLIEMNTTRARIETVAYSCEEFEKMLGECHLTALEAMEFGIPLYGRRYFAQLRRLFNNMKTRGLQRGHTSWHIALT